MKRSQSVAKAETIPASGVKRAEGKRRPPGSGEVDLADVAAFVRVVDAGSFTRAAGGGNLPKSALSRRVSRLERALGVRLLQRTTRSLALTDAGTAYHQRASDALAQLEEARDLAGDSACAPAGVVRISIPVDFGSGPLSRVLTDFARQHPNIHLEVDASNRRVDLVAENFDLAIRAGKLNDSTLVARKLGEAPMILAAAPSYLERKGRPRTVADLAKHDCILFRSVGGSILWTLTGPNGAESVTVRGPVSANDFSFVRAALVNGVGIAMLPSGAASEDIAKGTVEQVLPKYLGPVGPVHLVYPSARFVPMRVVTLRDYLLKNLRVDALDGMSAGGKHAAKAR